MTDNIARWREDHVNFARLLDLLETQLELFHWGQTPDHTLMLDIMSYMTGYPDLSHHPKEDLAFAKVAERVAASRPVVEELMREHERLTESSASLVRQLEGVLSDAVLTRANVEAPGRSYVDCFRRHMRREEDELFPVIAKTLTRADWRAIDEQLEHRHDPLFGARVEERFASLQRHIALEAGGRLPG